VDKPLESVTHDQCYARPMVTFPAAERHHPSTGTKLYCLVNRDTCVNNLPKVVTRQCSAWSQTCNLQVTSLACYRYSTATQYKTCNR